MPAFELTQKQQQANELLAGKATHLLLYGGSRSGKTFLILRAIISRAIKAPKSRHAVMRFRFNALKSAIIYDTMPKVMELCWPGMHYEMNKSDWFLGLENGSTVWFGGLDDKERTEKILGNEYASMFLNECSQIPWSSRNLAITRLAQRVPQQVDGLTPRDLPLRVYYDCNPPDRGHWTYRAFIQRIDPDTKESMPAEVSAQYAAMQLNPVDNRENLPADYIKGLEGLSGRMQRRFLHGEFREANPSGLFPVEHLDKWRQVSGQLPEMQRVIVALDPSGAGDVDNQDNDEIGIIVAGLGTDGNGYILEDLTCKAGPATWGRIATTAYDRHEADVIVGETNYGGAMVGEVIRTARPRTPFREVTASRGKVVRAEPFSALFEQGKVRIVGYQAELEEELAGMTTGGYLGEGSPNRADAMIWALAELFPGLIRDRSKSRPERPRLVSGGWMGT